MKIVIFAGGVGTRLWPLSRRNTPKQFEKIIGDRSTLQQTVDRLTSSFSPSDIYIATGKRYEEIVKSQLPLIPKENFIFEPEMRDVGPAIGLVSALLEEKFQDEPIAIIWSDHLVKNIEAFIKVLRLAQETIKAKKSNFVFIAQKARFANQNMGWIELGEEVEDKNGLKIFQFKRLRYRPRLEEVLEFFKNKNYVWNLGYFVTTPFYLTSLYKAFAPSIFQYLLKIKEAKKVGKYEETLLEVYPKLEKISFDDLILAKMKEDNIYVISEDLGWSDVGAWEALKEALCPSEDDNLTKGNVMLEDCRDSLSFSYTNQLVVGIDLSSLLVVNTNDVLLICPKTSVPKIKKLVEKLAGTPHEQLT